MSESNLDIVIRFIQQGDLKGAAAELQKVLDATKEDKKATDATTVSKKQWIDQLKALKHEIPGLGTAITLIKNPLVAIGATIGIGISLWRQWAASVREASIAAYELAHAQNAMPKADIIIAVAAATKLHADALQEIKDNASGAAIALNLETEAFLANQRATEKLADAETALKLAQIKASDKPDAVKILEIEKVTAEARHRKEQAEVDAAEQAAAAEAKRIGIARGALAQAQQQGPTDEAIKEQTRLAGHYAGQNKVLLPQLEQDKGKLKNEIEKLMSDRDEIVGRIRTGNIGGLESASTLRSIRLPEKDREISAKQKEIDLIDQQVEASKGLEANTKKRLDDMTRERDKRDKNIQDQTAIIESSRLGPLMEDFDRKRRTNTKASGFLDAAGSIDAGREAQEAEQREKERLLRERKQAFPQSSGRSPAGGVDTSEVIGAANDLGQSTQSGLGEVAAVLHEHAREIKLINQRIKNGGLTSP